jgi:hypothetical protein
VSALEKHCKLVARDVIPGEPDNGELSGSFLDTLTAIMAIVQQVMEMCPQQAKEKAAGLRKPTVRQKVAVFIATQRTARDMGLPPSRTGEIYKYLVARGAMLTEAEALELAEETASVDNLLI